MERRNKFYSNAFDKLPRFILIIIVILLLIIAKVNIERYRNECKQSSLEVESRERFSIMHQPDRILIVDTTNNKRYVLLKNEDGTPYVQITD